MRVKRKQGRYVSIYITEDLIKLWESLESKSKFVQEALREKQDYADTEQSRR
jgi:hypothetical protein